MDSWHIYIIECADGRLYTGITTDLPRRFEEHQSGGAKAAKALRGKGPLKLVYTQQVQGRSIASKLEAAIKKLQRNEKLALIHGRRELPHFTE